MRSLKNTLWTIVFGLGLVCGPVAAQTDSAKIPEAFHGNWYEKSTQCTGAIYEPISIGESGYSEGEHSAGARSVKIISPSEIEVTFDYYGEPTTESDDTYAGQSTRTLTLLDNGQTLKFTSQYEGQIYEGFYQRCPNWDNPVPEEQTQPDTGA